ncbi:MAG: DUF3316 domain-containing protein [Bacteroidaceae bacterium]|nr:DUF3316 domain-containing protein [Bacteroidaceae bacterium]
MRFLLKMIALLILSAVSTVSKAQFANGDSINPCHIKVSASTYGITKLVSLDTYLSSYEHFGGGYFYNHENFRDARTGEFMWKYQTLFSGMAGFTELYDSQQYILMLNRSWSGFHKFHTDGKIDFYGGAQIQLAGGAIYAPANSNNPVAAKLQTSLAATGMAIYHIDGKAFRIQLDLPLIGAAFSPGFGQSYYEIFGLGNYSNIIHLTHPGNAPSWRLIVTYDCELGKKRNTTLRISFINEALQSDINDIRTSINSGSLSVGFVKTLYKIKGNSPLKPYNPFR